MIPARDVTSSSGVATPGRHRPPLRRWHDFVFVLALVALSAGSWWQLLRPGVPFSYDGDLHVVRTLHLENELRAGQFPARWGSDQAWGYGYPTFNFYYPLPYYATAALHIAGLPASEAFKALFILSLGSGAVFTGLWSRRVWGTWGGIVAAFVYVGSPPLLQAVYLAMSVGAVAVLGLLPLILWAVLRACAPGASSLRHVGVASFGLAAALLSHNFFGPLSLVLVASYSVSISIAQRRTLPLRLSGVVIGAALGLSAFFWLPAFMELADTAQPLQSVGFPLRAELVDFGVGPRMGRGEDGTPFAHHRDTLGAAAVVSVALTLGAAVALRDRLSREQQVHLLFALAAFAGLVALMVVPFRREFWLALPVLRSAESASRLLLPTAVVVAFAAGVVSRLTWSRPLVTAALVVLAVGYGAAYARPAVFQRANDDDYRSYSPIMDGTADWHRTVLPKWAHLGSDAPLIDPQPSVVEGAGRIVAYNRQSVRHDLHVEMASAGLVSLPVFFFPGWQARVDGVAAPIAASPQDGTILVGVGEGSRRIDVRFTNTPVRTAGNVISLVSLGAVTVVGGAHGLRQRANRRRVTPAGAA